ncbi:MAG: hypothetical protein PF636_09665 [Actinomycetota bacterium]|jgi:hypothetical protein|nr:hypothetical protein [Actinomycetota bacterium]
MRALSSLLLAATIVLMSGCATVQSSDSAEASTAEAPIAVSQQESELTLPPPLTAAPPEEVPWSSPNGRTPDESRRLAILTQWKHGSLEEAGGGVPFEPRLPVETLGSSLQYLLTSYRDVDPASPQDGYFTAMYSDGTIELMEWAGSGPGSESTNDIVRGFPAVVSQTSDGRADLMWAEDSVVFHLWFSGTVEDARRIAESIPR